MKCMKVFLVVCVCLLLCACEKKCEHAYQEEITVKPTCTQEGETTYTCTLCQDSYKESLVKSEHTYGENGVVKEATCSAEGEIATVCKVCGDQKFVEKIPMNDVHQFEEKTVRAATCTKKGEGLKTCTLCQYSEKCEYEAPGHQYGKAEVTKQPTCTKKGSQKSECSVCGKVKTESVKATGHAYTTIKDEKPRDNCARTRVQKCNDCGKTKTTYHGDNYTYNLDEIRTEIAKYLKSKGVEVAYSGDTSGYQEYVEGEYIYLIDLAGNGPKKMIERMKKLVDSMGLDTPADVKDKTVIVHIKYSDTTAGGLFTWSFCPVFTSLM